MAAPRGRAGQWHKISRTFIQDGSEMHKQLPDLYAALRARAQELPPDGAHALYIAGRRCGWATHAAADALQGADHVETDHDSVRIGEGMTPAPSWTRCWNGPRYCCAMPTACAAGATNCWTWSPARQAGRDGAHRAAALRPADQGRAPERLDARRPAVGGAPRPEQINGSRYVGHPGRRTGRQRRTWKPRWCASVARKPAWTNRT